MTKTVLVAEDDADARNTLRAALEERGFRVVVAVHGAEGVHLARRTRPDLILMDLRMPVMDGGQAIRYLRADPMTARIPIWGISAYLAEVADDDVVRTGCDRLIEKPIVPAELALEVERLLGDAGQPPNEPPRPTAP